MVTNTEVWYGLLDSVVDELEEVDRLVIKWVLELPNPSSIESLYIELGLCPIGSILKAMGIIYLQYLVKLKDNEMLRKFVEAQWQYPVKND